MVGFMGVALTVAAQTPSTPSIDLVWEADTYVPAGYEGRALPTASTNVTVMAIAHQGSGQIVNNYDFRWEKDGKQIISASGVGANILHFKAGTPGVGHHITLALHDPSGKRIVSQSTNIIVRDPKVVFYKEESWGVDHSRAITNNLPLTQPETKLVAEPFYFLNTAITNRGLGYDWRLNGASVEANTENPRHFSLLLPDPLPEAAQATLELRLVNLSETLQKASHSILATYGQN